MHDHRSHLGDVAASQLLTHLPSGVLVTEPGGRIVLANPTAEHMLGRAVADGELTCCGLLGCRQPATPLAGACITELALQQADPLAEIRLDLEGSGSAQSAWVIAAVVPATPPRVILQLRPGAAGDRRRRTSPHWRAASHLRLHCLGRMEIETDDGPLGGDWLGHRPGTVLKFLIARRGRVVLVEELLEELWPTGRGRGLASVRQAVHLLRRELEPDRDAHQPSAFVIAHRGGYELNLDSVTVDADIFEREADAAITAAAVEPDRAAAESLLTQAVDLYRGDFLAEEPYADWALGERERLRELAAQTLRVLIEMRLEEDDWEGGLDALRRLVELEPYDLDAHGQLLRLMIQRGQRTEALRRLSAVRNLYRRTLGSEPPLELADLLAP